MVELVLKSIQPTKPNSAGSAAESWVVSFEVTSKLSPMTIDVTIKKKGDEMAVSLTDAVWRARRQVFDFAFDLGKAADPGPA